MNKSSKLKSILELFHPKSLIQKCLLMVTAAMIITMFLLQFIMNQWIYSQVEPGLLKNYTTLVSAVGTQVSYLLHQNTQYVKALRADESLLESLSKVPDFFDRDVQEQYKAEIAKSLSSETRGGTEPGAIVSSRSALALVDWDEWVCQEDMLPYLETIAQSEWLQTLPRTLKELDAQYDSQICKRYSPVFAADPERNQYEFLSLATFREWNGHEIAFFMVEPFSEFRSILKGFERNQILDYALLGPSVSFVAQNSPEFSDILPDNTDSLVTDRQYEVRQTMTSDGILFGVRISYSMEDLRLTAYMPKEVYLKPYTSFMNSVNLVLVLLLFSLLVFILLILRGNLSRLKALSHQMTDIRTGSVKKLPRLSGEDEIGILSDNFYRLLDQLEENIAQIKRQEKREKEIEYSLLISQIDPHFIYNTLNTITYLAELNRYQDITVINKALIEMLRDRLKITKLQIYDSIAKEEQQLQYYITIQNYLCGNRISLQFDASDSQLLYPKNILQPLVENAVFHGILLHRNEAGEKLKGLIQIQITHDSEWTRTVISDNGVGMSSEALRHYFVELPNSIAEFEKTSGSHTHIGIYNIRMRLSYLYGEAVQISADSPDGGGLRITLRFPSHSS